MTAQLNPADALELELAGIVTGECSQNLIAVVATLRSASGAIAAPPGLRARRGAMVASAVNRTALRPPRTLSRRLQATLMATTLTVVGGVSFVGASVGISWLRDAVPAAPAPHGRPGAIDSDRLETPSPSRSASPSPVLHRVTGPEALHPADSDEQNGPDPSDAPEHASSSESAAPTAEAGTGPGEAETYDEEVDADSEEDESLAPDADESSRGDVD